MLEQLDGPPTLTGTLDLSTCLLFGVFDLSELMLRYSSIAVNCSVKTHYLTFSK